MIKYSEKPVIDCTMEPVHKGKWRNLIFDKQGRTYTGRNLHKSRDAAEEKIRIVERDRDRGLTHGVVTREGNLLWKSYSHAIPMPVGDA